MDLREVFQGEVMRVNTPRPQLIGGLRQLLYPREFRIGKPLWPVDLVEMLDKLSSLRLTDDNVISTTSIDLTADKDRLRFLVDVGTGLWRLGQKMVEPGTDRPLETMRKAFRHWQSTWDALAEAGVEIQDHTGKPFDSGQELIPVLFQPTPGLERERILETVKPSIYYKGKRIQVGEVIVGKPGQPAGGPAGPSSFPSSQS
jgi:hypothetical protein